MVEKLENIGRNENCGAIYFVLEKDSPARYFWEKYDYIIIKSITFEIIPGKEEECYIMAKSLG